MDAALSAARLWVRSSAAWMRGFSHADTKYERTKEFKNASRRKTSKKEKKQNQKNKEKEELESQKKEEVTSFRKKLVVSNRRMTRVGWAPWLRLCCCLCLLLPASACQETWADFASISAPWNPSTELCGQKAPPDLEMTSGLWKSISFSTGLPGMAKTHIKGPPEHLDVTSGQAMSAACRRRVRCHSAVPLLVAPRRWEMLRLRIDGAREILISRLQQFLAGIDAWLLQSPLWLMCVGLSFLGELCH